MAKRTKVQIERQEWMVEFEKRAVESGIYPAGKVDWDTAAFYFIEGRGVEEAISMINKLWNRYIDVPLEEDWQKGRRMLRVTLDDVAKYYAQEAHSMSGCRTLAGETGDWRPVDQIANFCLEHFKQVNIEGMREAGRKYGLVPKF